MADTLLCPLNSAHLSTRYCYKAISTNHNKIVVWMIHYANNVMSCQYAFLPNTDGCFSLSGKVDLAQIGPDSLLAAADDGDSEVLMDY